jgi:tetratricopeptide (TPR) repeat protein
MSRPALLALALLLAAACPALAGPMEDAKAAEAKGDFAAAATLYAAAVEKDPTSRPAVLGLARAAARGFLTERFVAAQDALHALLEAKADDAEVLVSLGDLNLAMAATKTDDTDRRFTYEEAKVRFEEALRVDASSEAAAVGLARTLYEIGDPDGAVAAVDAFLAKGRSKGPALYWKGQALYLLATDAYRQAGAMDDAARAHFEKARGAYEAAASADATSTDAWMQLGYTAQYLGLSADARAAYEKVMALDAENVYALKGIEALYAYDQAAYGKVLADLAATHPKNLALSYFRAHWYLRQGDWDPAIQALEAYREKSKAGGAAWTFLGYAHQQKGDLAKAEEAWWKALAFNGNDETSAGALDGVLRERLFAEARRSPAGAKALVAAYRRLLDAAPGNADVRNNLAFMLREAVDQNGKGAGPWAATLKDCVEAYVDAAKAVEGILAAHGDGRSLPVQRRYDLAGILNDTGLMFHYYPAVQDLEQAERYYVRALDVTETGHFDAFTNLLKVYLGKDRWQDAYDLAADAAEGLTDATGAPHDTGRGMARGAMKRLVDEGRVTPE